MVVLSFLVIWIVCIVACAILADNKGRSVGGWVVLAIVLGPITLLLAAVVPNLKQEQLTSADETGSRPCPFCAERIKRQAVVCSYCGRDVPRMAPVPEAVETQSAPPKWLVYFARAVAGALVLAFLAVVLILHFGGATH